MYKNPLQKGERISFIKLSVDPNRRKTSFYRRLHLMPGCEYEIDCWRPIKIYRHIPTATATTTTTNAITTTTASAVTTDTAIATINTATLQKTA
jgi:hypothetical protein